MDDMKPVLRAGNEAIEEAAWVGRSGAKHSSVVYEEHGPEASDLINSGFHPAMAELAQLKASLKSEAPRTSTKPKGMKLA